MENQRAHPFLLQNRRRKATGKILRKDSLSEAGVRLGRDLEDRAKTTSVRHSRTFGVILGNLPCVRITEQNRDANSVKSTLLCTERLTVSPTKDRTNTMTITMTITTTITIKIQLELDLEKITITITTTTQAVCPQECPFSCVAFANSFSC